LVCSLLCGSRPFFSSRLEQQFFAACFSKQKYLLNNTVCRRFAFYCQVVKTLFAAQEQRSLAAGLKWHGVGVPR